MWTSDRSCNAVGSHTPSSANICRTSRSLPRCGALAAQAPDGAVRAESLPMAIKIDRAPGTKCPRCWNYSEAVDATHPICARCAEALKG